VETIRKLLKNRRTDTEVQRHLKNLGAHAPLMSMEWFESLLPAAREISERAMALDASHFKTSVVEFLKNVTGILVDSD